MTEKLRKPQETPLEQRPAEEPRDTFRRQLQEARKRAGLSQVALADKVKRLGGDLQPTAITRIEKGNREVSLVEALLLAAALGVSPLHLIVPLTNDVAVRLTPTARMRRNPFTLRDWIRGWDPLLLETPEHLGTLAEPPSPTAHDFFYAWAPEEDRRLRANPAYNALSLLVTTLAMALYEDAGAVPATDEEHQYMLGQVERRLRTASEEVSHYVHEARSGNRAEVSFRTQVAGEIPEPSAQIWQQRPPLVRRSRKSNKDGEK